MESMQIDTSSSQQKLTLEAAENLSILINYHIAKGDTPAIIKALNS